MAHQQTATVFYIYKSAGKKYNYPPGADDDLLYLSCTTQWHVLKLLGIRKAEFQFIIEFSQANSLSSG